MEYGWSGSFGTFGGGSGVLRPPNPDDIIQWLDGTDGATANDRLSVLSTEPTLDGVNCLSVTGGSVGFPVALNFGSNDFTVSGYFKSDNTSTNGNIICGRDAFTDGFRAYILSTGTFRVGYNASTLSVTGSFNSGAVYGFIVQKTGGNLTATVYDGNGSVVNTGTIAVTGSIDVTTNARIGSSAYTGSDLFIGKISNICVEGYIDAPLQEGAGVVAYEQGLSDGTIINCTWTTDDDMPSHNHSYGFTRYEHSSSDPIFVPGGRDGTYRELEIGEIPTDYVFVGIHQGGKDA